jgi:hypothetical protein
MVDGYEFHWPAFCAKPYLISPNGYKIEMEVEKFVPYLREYFPTVPANPVAADGNVVPEQDQDALFPQETPDREIGDAPAADDLLERLKTNKLSPKEMALYKESKTIKHISCHLPVL